MKANVFKMILSALLIVSCDVSRSVNLQAGLVTKGNGLSCEEVYLSAGDRTIQRSTFTYGEGFHVNFNHLEGFERENSRVFPGMQLLVVSDRGDTVLKKDDLYAGMTNGTDVSPLLLQAEVTVADPIHSGQGHTLYIRIWDKKGNGTFQASMDFVVVPDEKIAIESNRLSFDEVYLFSREKGKTVTGDRASLDEHVYMIFEGLDGFVVQEGSVLVGLGMKITDASGQVILDEEDLIGDSEMDADELHTRLSPSFILTGSEVDNPVSVEIRIWDKRGAGRIRASTRLQME